MIKINIGCGSDIKNGWVNLDNHKECGANYIFDLQRVFDGEPLPFPDNHFDYIYCSHVIEDFIEPMTLIKEFIRICKVGGRIEIRTPFETNGNTTNPYHKSLWTLGKFKAIANGINHYGEKSELEIEELCYYDTSYISPGIRIRGRVFNKIEQFNTWLFNLLGHRMVESTFVKYLLCLVNCKVIYIKRDCSLNTGKVTE